MSKSPLFLSEADKRHNVKENMKFICSYARQ